MSSHQAHAAIAAALIAVCAHTAVARARVIYTFTDATDGGFPEGGVIADAHGNLFGTTTSGGTSHSGVVYELSPKAGGKGWTQATLYAFGGGNDGANPQAGLLGGTNGRLYGTTYAGGASGQAP